VLYGHIVSAEDPAALCERLKAAGLPAACRKSVHYSGGRYVNVETDRARLTLERVTPKEYLVGGDADSLEDFHDAGKALSEELTRLAVRHRLEIYDGDRLVAYFDHEWSAG
jgi:hypothetical protein